MIERGHPITRSVPMTPTITAFERSPDRGRGLARDMRLRWALEEVGQPYDVRLISFSEMKGLPHRSLSPFGQIPTYGPVDDDGAAQVEQLGCAVRVRKPRRVRRP